MKRTALIFAVGAVGLLGLALLLLQDTILLHLSPERLLAGSWYAQAYQEKAGGDADLVRQFRATLADRSRRIREEAAGNLSAEEEPVFDEHYWITFDEVGEFAVGQPTVTGMYEGTYEVTSGSHLDLRVESHASGEHVFEEDTAAGFKLRLVAEDAIVLDGDAWPFFARNRSTVVLLRSEF